MWISKLAAPSFLLAALLTISAVGAESTLPNESLRYSVNWPTGVSLGEAQLSASSSPEHMHFQFNLDAGAPAFTVSDRFNSDASGSYCSSHFDKSIAHGSRKFSDKETFNSQTGAVTRGSGASQAEMDGSPCGKDALTFLYFVRQELSQGRLPPQETVYFGAPYEVRLSSAGSESVKVGGASVDADRITAAISGPSSSLTVELVFLKDRARTLALVRVPLALGTFSMELVK